MFGTTVSKKCSENCFQRAEANNMTIRNLPQKKKHDYPEKCVQGQNMQKISMQVYSQIPNQKKHIQKLKPPNGS